MNLAALNRSLLGTVFLLLGFAFLFLNDPWSALCFLVSGGLCFIWAICTRGL